MGAVGSSLVACCSERDNEPMMLIHPADDSAFKLKMKLKMNQASWSRRVQLTTCPSSAGTEKQRNKRAKKAVQLSEWNVKADGAEEEARVPSPKLQDYREVEQLGRVAGLATDAADHSSQAYAPITAVAPLPAQLENSCQPAQASAQVTSVVPLPAQYENRGQPVHDSNGSAPTSPFVLDRTASDLKVPDPPLAALANVTALCPQEEPSRLLLGDTDDNSRLTQPPSKLDGEAKASLQWHVNTISGLSEGLASKFREQRNKEATGESAIGNIGEKRNSIFEPVQLEDRLACRFEQQRAKERAGTATSVVSLDGARAARRSDGIAIVDKVLSEKLARQRLKADGHSGTSNV